MPATSRIRFSLAALLMAAALSMTTEALAQDPALWQRYKDTFLTRDGRVVDFKRGDISTSESQAYCMLLAEAYADRATFELAWGWAKANLGVRHDGLMAWSWGKRPTGQWEALDFNNATDADVMMAYALLRAHRRWGHAPYQEAARSIMASLKDKLGLNREGRTVLLPGYYGFDSPEGIVLNPSYIILPAYRMFAETMDAEFWNSAARSGASLIHDACIGRPCLPADWVRLGKGGQLTPAEPWPFRFGAEAIRVFLHLAWDRSAQPEGLSKVLSAYEKLGYVPLWMDLRSGEAAKEPAPAGFYAVVGLAALRSGNPGLGEKIAREARARLDSEAKDYYSFSLYLLATIEEEK